MEMKAAIHSFDGINLVGLGKNAFAKFEARRRRGARVTWLNEEWFLERGLDVLDRAVRCAVDDWLISEFAFTVPDGCDPESDYEKDFVELHADRYGEILGSAHGGSGRAATIGSFNVKGIGRTPLAGALENVDWYHWHGCMWREEAIREAIFSKVAGEFPYGAVPIIAVVDLFARVHGPQGAGEWRSLIVRPNFVRPSHFLRSIFHGSGDAENSHQRLDADRVADAWNAISDADQAHDLDIPSGGLIETFRRIGAQIGYGFAHRLTNELYFSSNITTSGALTDFGAFSALSSWRAQEKANGMLGFGREFDNAEYSLGQYAFYSAKHRGVSNAFDPREILRSMRHATQRAFERELATVCYSSNDAATNDLIGILDKSIREENRIVERFSENGSNTSSHSFHQVDVDQLVAPLGFSADDRRLVSARLRRFLRPRSSALRSTLQKTIFSQIAGWPDRPELSQELPRFVSTAIAAASRTFPYLDRDRVVLGVTDSGHGKCVYTMNPLNGATHATISTPLLASAGAIRIFGVLCRLDALNCSAYEIDQKLARVTFTCPPEAFRSGFMASSASGENVAIPPSQEIFEQHGCI